MPYGIPSSCLQKRSIKYARLYLVYLMPSHPYQIIAEAIGMPFSLILLAALAIMWRVDSFVYCKYKNIL